MNSHRTFIIAEAGVNHNGSFDMALKLIEIAVEAKVDAVKFQTWKTELLLTKEADLAEYQKDTSHNFQNQYDLVKDLELSIDEFIELKKFCDSKHIIFFSTPDEIVSANNLIDLQDIFKIGSGEITNIPYLRHIGGFKKKVILSTGMSNLEEVEKAIDTLNSSGTPKPDITVLHCNTEYPTPMEDVNLKAMLTIRDKLGVTVGYSDHTLGIEIPIAAVAIGARVIEKHFTIDRTLKGPDHRASLEPNELKSMVKAIRNIEIAMGDGIKIAQPSEIKNIPIARKSIVAQKIISKGDLFSIDNLTTKRPGNGISAVHWDKLIGSVAKRDYKNDELIDQ
jgi:N,N'-diacetyllegionaminate synthase